MIFDTHAHYHDSAFNEDRDGILSSLPSHRVGTVVNIGDNIESSKASIMLAEKYSFVYAAVGVHPQHAETLGENEINTLRSLSKNKNVVAVGEIGLDYYYKEPDREIQKNAFRLQMGLANEVKLPVIIHDREAHKDCYTILKEENVQNTGGVMHCFSGSVEFARDILNLGMYIALGGVVTFKNAVKAVEVAKYIPDDRLLLETDCPYLSPAPFRGKRNNSAYIIYTAKKIAELRNMSTEEVLNITEANAKRFYRL